MSDIGERNAIDLVTRILGGRGVLEGKGVMRGIGDDCAVLEDGDNYLLVSTDMVSGKTHIGGFSPSDMGWHLMAVNLSDIASMGGEPIGAVIALGLRPDDTVGMLEGIVDGVSECAAIFKVPVIGGDTKEAAEVTLTATVLGRVDRNAILLRTGASPGDRLYVTGELGRARVGFEARRTARVHEVPDAVKAFTRPMPRIETGRELGRSGTVTSCMDISDGLVSSLHQMSEANGTGFVIRFGSLPISRDVEKMGLDPIEAGLMWGGEYELVFTAREDHPDHTVIGEVCAEKGVWMEWDGDLRPLTGGWEHFRPH